MISQSKTWESFLLWLQENGLDHRELKLAWSAFEETGRGMKAVVEIKPGDNILKIPSALLINWPMIVKRHNFQKYPQLLEKIGCNPPSQFTPESFHIGELCVNIENFLWAWLVVNTRSIYLNDPKAHVNSAGLAPIALAPYLDLLNHNPQTKVADIYDSRSGTFTFVSGQRYQPGEQVFITYGAHDNVALMIEYGFVIPTNPYDYACIDLHIWKYLLMEQEPIDNLDDLLAERLSPLPIMNVLQQNDLLRNLAVQSDGEPDFRFMNLLRLWHLPCYNIQTTKHASDTSCMPKQHIQNHIRKKGYKTPTSITLPKETEEYWLDLWYSIWSGTSEAFPEKHRIVEAAAYSSLTGILTAAFTSVTQTLTKVQNRISNDTLSLGENELLHQLKVILDTELSLLDKALTWARETHPDSLE